MQIADVIQIALLCVQIFVAAVQVITTLYFIRSVGITQQQEKDAKDQILLAQKQLELAQKQMELMASQSRESLRPLIAVKYKQAVPGAYEVEFSNEGLGPALSVNCEQELILQGTVIGSKSTAVGRVPMPATAATNKLFTLTYKSLDGQCYATSFHQQNAVFSVVDYRHLGSTEDRGLLEEFRSGFRAANA
jgi:hypothetical protein